MNNNIIQLTGLPRSGTAFMSAFFSLHPNCIAIHEAIALYDNSFSIFNALSYCYDYVVDCSTYGYIDKHIIPNSKKIYIERSIIESHKSSQNLYNIKFDISYFKSLKTILNNWEKTYKPYKVKFENLFNIKKLHEIWIFAFGNDDFFDATKVELLLNLKIENKLYNEMIKDPIISNRIDINLTQLINLN